MAKKERKMEEVWAFEQLKAAWPGDLEYGPDPPDLVYNGRAAIEVRLLKRYYENKGIVMNIDTLHRSMYTTFNEVIKEFHFLNNERSIDIQCGVFPPVGKTKTMKKIFRAILTSYLDGGVEKFQDQTLTVKFYPSTVQRKTKFHLFYLYIGDYGGYIHELVTKSFNVALAEKEKKLVSYKSNYEQCWLALLDEITAGMQLQDIAKLWTEIPIVTKFDKIFLISAWEGAPILELYNKHRNV